MIIVNEKTECDTKKSEAFAIALSKIKIDFFIHSSFVERVTDLELIMFYHIVFALAPLEITSCHL